MKVLPDYCQAEAQESPKGGQERGKEYIRTCRKKGCGGNAVAPHTPWDVRAAPAAEFQGQLRAPFPPESKNFKILPVQSRGLWVPVDPLMIFSKILQQKFQPGLINFPPNSQTGLTNFQ